VDDKEDKPALFIKRRTNPMKALPPAITSGTPTLSIYPPLGRSRSLVQVDELLSEDDGDAATRTRGVRKERKSDVEKQFS
jgi:hypothetical protein